MNIILERREVDLKQRKIQEVLPEYFLTEYPALITFLEKYYDFLKDTTDNRDFDQQIKNLLTIRDIQKADLKYLDLLIREIGNGIQASDFFDQPRLMTSLLADYYKVKGSFNSIEGFFKGFYGQDVFVEYPKRNMFIVGESEIGIDSLKFLQDDKLYQIFSILIKVGMSTADYEQLYKKFVHPAGFYFAGQVLLEEEVTLDLDDVEGVVDPREIDDNPKYVNEVLVSPTVEFNDLTGLYTQDGVIYRTAFDNIIEKYGQISTDTLENIYGNDYRITDLFSPNSFTFDDTGPNMSNNFETMDADMFTRYTSDSAY